MFCGYCGKEGQEGQKFCPYCGKTADTVVKNEKLVHTPPVQEQPSPIAEQQKNQEPVPIKKRKKSKLPIIIVAVVLVAAIIAGVIFVQEPLEYAMAPTASELLLNEENVELISEKIVKEFNRNSSSEIELIEVSTVQSQGPYIEADFLITTGLTENIYDISFYPISETNLKFSRAYIYGYRGNDINEIRIQEHQHLVIAFETVLFGKTTYKENQTLLKSKKKYDNTGLDVSGSYSLTDKNNISFTAEIHYEYGYWEYFDYKIYEN